MKIPCDEYMLALSIDEALDALVEGQGDSCFVSGGTDLLLELQQGSRPAVHRLVDVSEIAELCALEVRNASLFIGASVTLARLVNSPLIEEHAQALADAVKLMAYPQVCNVATIGGNVAHALPAADGTISLLALDAVVEVANLEGRRLVPLSTMFKGPRESSLDPHGDLLVGFYIPLHKTGQASAFTRRVNPQGVALAMLNLAIWLEREGERIKQVRVAVGPAGPIPMRMPAAENALLGQEYSPKLLAHALRKLLHEAHFRTSPHRATAEYRQNLAGVLFHEAISKAWARAA